MHKFQREPYRQTDTESNKQQTTNLKKWMSRAIDPEPAWDSQTAGYGMKRLDKVCETFVCFVWCPLAAENRREKAKRQGFSVGENAERGTNDIDRVSASEASRETEDSPQSHTPRGSHQTERSLVRTTDPGKSHTNTTPTALDPFKRVLISLCNHSNILSILTRHITHGTFTVSGDFMSFLIFLHVELLGYTTCLYAQLSLPRLLTIFWFIIIIFFICGALNYCFYRFHSLDSILHFLFKYTCGLKHKCIAA